MIVQSPFLKNLRDELESMKAEVQNQFYYLGKEDLLYKKDEKSWNIIEIFEHLNIFNHYYIKTISKVLTDIPTSTTDTFKISWFGKKFIQTMKPKDGKVKNKMPTFAKANPIKLQKDGKVLVAHIVFQDFINDIDTLLNIIVQCEGRAIGKVKVKSFIPILKFNIAEALAVITAHTSRHIIQAKNTLRKD